MLLLRSLPVLRITCWANGKLKGLGCRFKRDTVQDCWNKKVLQRVMIAVNRQTAVVGALSIVLASAPQRDGMAKDLRSSNLLWQSWGSILPTLYRRETGACSQVL